MLGMSLLTLALTASPVDAGAGDAWAEWTRWEDFMQTLDAPALQLAGELTPSSRFSRDELAAAADAKSVLDLAHQKLRRGLESPTCTMSSAAPTRLMLLAEAVGTRAILAAQQGEDFTPQVLDLLAAGRKVARCAGGGLVALSFGLELEHRARTLAEWGAAYGLLPAPSRERLQRAFASQPLGRADFEQALTQEALEATRALPAAMPQSERDYSRSATEALVTKSFARIRGAAPKDAEKLEQELLALVSPDEKAALRDAQVLVDSKQATKAQVDALFARVQPNVLGRLTVVSTVAPLAAHAVTIGEDVRVATEPLRLPSKPRAQGWLK